MVSADSGWWFPEKDLRDPVQLSSNINILTMARLPLDPGMGTTNLKGLMCQIKKATHRYGQS